MVSTDVKGFWRRTYYRVLQHYCGGPPANPRILVDPKADAKQREAEKTQQERSGKPRDTSSKSNTIRPVISARSSSGPTLSPQVPRLIM